MYIKLRHLKAELAWAIDKWIQFISKAVIPEHTIIEYLENILCVDLTTKYVTGFIKTDPNCTRTKIHFIT